MQKLFFSCTILSDIALFLSLVILFVFSSVKIASAQLCSTSSSTICMELQNRSGDTIDEDSGSSNIHTASMAMESCYGKAVISQLKFLNTGSRDMIGSSLNFTSSILLPYINLQQSDFTATATNYAWPVVSYTGLVVPKGETKILDVVFAPVPGQVFTTDQYLDCYFAAYNPTDFTIPFLTFNTFFNETVSGSIGKKYSVSTDDSDGNTLVIITPDADAVSTLNDNEYLLVYFSIDQTDGNPDKEVVVLEKSENPVTSVNSGNADWFGASAVYSHHNFSNGNILLRSRDTGGEDNTRYWLLFKSSDPIELKCYKKTVVSGATSSGPALAKLKFVYTDERPDADGNYAPIEETVPVQGSTDTNTGEINPIGKPVILSPANNSVFTINDNIEFTWTAPVGYNGDGDLTYQVFYRDSSDAGYTEVEDDNPLDTSVTFPSSKLTESTTYYWKVKVTDINGETNESDVYSFMVTGEINPIGKPVILSPANHSVITTKDNVELKWGPPADYNGDLTYQVFYTYSEDGVDTPVTDNVDILLTDNTNFSGTSVTFPSSELTESTTYYWKVKVTDINGETNESDVYSFTVKVPAPATVDDNDFRILDYNTISPGSICPSISDQLGQPITFGDNPQANIKNKLVLQYSYPAYNPNVDIYFGVQYNNGSLFYLLNDSNESNVVEVSSDPTPYFSNIDSSKKGSIVLYDAGILEEISDLHGKFIFYSAVVPSNDHGTFAHYKIVSVEVPIPE